MWLSNAMTLLLWPSSVVGEPRKAIAVVRSTLGFKFRAHTTAQRALLLELLC